MNGMKRTNMEIRDEDLVAYIDGELDRARANEIARRVVEDPELAARIAALESGGRPFAEAFAPLLDTAPNKRLEAMLSETIARSTARSVQRRSGGSRRSGWIAMAASLIAVFFAGSLAGALIIEQQPPAPVTTKPGWRATVANYTQLYSAQAFHAATPVPEQEKIAQLKKLSSAFSSAFDLQDIEADGIQFRFARLLSFNNKPLAQIALTDSESRPVFYCIVPTNKPDSDIRFEVRNGQQVAHWNTAGNAYLVIGRAPREEVGALAARLRSSI